MAKNQIQELKNRQTKKWKHEALDDWKVLVNQLNEDRSRLEGEVSQLRDENARLKMALVEERRKCLGPDGAGVQGEEGDLQERPLPTATLAVEHELRSGGVD